MIHPFRQSQRAAGKMVQTFSGKILFFLLMLVIGSSGYGKPKYAIGLFHYNFQYVAGNYKIERRIVRESLYPALQFFDQHPQYRADLEFQGYAIEAMSEDYPEVLALLKKLVGRGQIELVVAHYSDQFFIAYPALDLRRSIELSDEILEKHGLNRSSVFFGQEIQYSPGLASALRGLYDVVVTSSDPYGYYRDQTLPLVNIRYGRDSILGFWGGGTKELNTLEWTWSFLDDGEVFNTLDYNSNFFRVPEQEQKNIAHFEKLEKEGYEFITISHLVHILKEAKDFPVREALLIPEGTWNMSVCGPFMWMGRQRSGVETDGITRALSYQLRGEILTAEKLILWAKKRGKAVGKLLNWLKEAWRHLFLSEVSDSSGWTPWPEEVQYTANEVATARTYLKKIFDSLRDMIPPTGDYLIVDTRTGKVTSTDQEGQQKGTEASLPIPFYVRAASYTTQIRQLSQGLYCMDITCKRPEDGAVEIAFETASGGLKWSAGAGEEAFVTLPEDLKHDPALALSNGFLYLGNGYTVIKDCSVEHLSVIWHRSDRRAVFREELNPANPQMNMRFYIRKGSPEEGHRLANRLNTWPVFRVWQENETVKMTKVFPEEKYK